MQRTRWAVIAVLVLVGAVWIGQGTGLLQGSSIMVGDPFWAFAGLALVVGGRSPGGADAQASRRVTQRFQVASSRPAATSPSKRTSGRRSRPGFEPIRSTISVSSMRR